MCAKIKEISVLTDALGLRVELEGTPATVLCKFDLIDMNGEAHSASSDDIQVEQNRIDFALLKAAERFSPKEDTTYQIRVWPVLLSGQELDEAKATFHIHDGKIVEGPAPKREDPTPADQPPPGPPQLPPEPAPIVPPPEPTPANQQPPAEQPPKAEPPTQLAPPHDSREVIIIDFGPIPDKLGFLWKSEPVNRFFRVSLVEIPENGKPIELHSEIIERTLIEIASNRLMAGVTYGIAVVPVSEEGLPIGFPMRAEFHVLAGKIHLGPPKAPQLPPPAPPAPTVPPPEKPKNEEQEKPRKETDVMTEQQTSPPTAGQSAPTATGDPLTQQQLQSLLRQIAAMAAPQQPAGQTPPPAPAPSAPPTTQAPAAAPSGANWKLLGVILGAIALLALACYATYKIAKSASAAAPISQGPTIVGAQASTIPTSLIGSNMSLGSGINQVMITGSGSSNSNLKQTMINYFGPPPVEELEYVPYPVRVRGATVPAVPRRIDCATNAPSVPTNNAPAATNVPTASAPPAPQHLPPPLDYRPPPPIDYPGQYIAYEPPEFEVYGPEFDVGFYGPWPSYGYFGRYGYYGSRYGYYGGQRGYHGRSGYYPQGHLGGHASHSGGQQMGHSGGHSGGQQMGHSGGHSGGGHR